MSLTGALHTGRTGLAVNQAALEVTGNNISNANTDGYTRRSALTTAAQGVEVGPGQRIGAGVRLEGIERQVDEALNSRLRSAVSDREAAKTRQDLLDQIESIHNELSDQGLSTRLNELFNAFSKVADAPTDGGLRSLAVSEGGAIADFMRGMRDELGTVRRQVDQQIDAQVERANQLMDKVADLNSRIVQAEGGRGGGANSLRDERDQTLKELSRILDISADQQESGSLNVRVGSTPIVLGDQSRGLAKQFEAEDGQQQLRLTTEQGGNAVEPTSGTLGQLIDSRNEDVAGAVEKLDTLAGGLIHEVNKVHSSGQGAEGFQSVSSTRRVADPSAALNSDDAELPFNPTNGTFRLHVTQKSTGQRNSQQIEVDLDGIGSDTSLNDLAAQIDAAANVSASVTAAGQLSISTSSSDFAVSFSEDSSGALASLGVNTFFTGSTAADIGVNPTLREQPQKLAAAQDHTPGGNTNAVELANLGDRPAETLDGQSIRRFWDQHVQDYAIRADQTSQRVEATRTVAEGLNAQRESVSGVSIDEEAVNMLSFQRAFQGSARFINVVDQMMQTTLGLIR